MHECPSFNQLGDACFLHFSFNPKQVLGRSEGPKVGPTRHLRDTPPDQLGDAGFLHFSTVSRVHAFLCPLLACLLQVNPREYLIIHPGGNPRAN